MNDNRRVLILDLTNYIYTIRNKVINNISTRENMLNKHGDELDYQYKTIMVEILDLCIATATRLILDNTFIDTDKYYIENLNKWLLADNNIHYILADIKNIVKFFTIQVVNYDLLSYVLYVDDFVNDTVYVSAYTAEVYHRINHIDSTIPY